MRAVRLRGGLFFRVQLSPPYAVTAMGVEEIMGQFAPMASEIMPFHVVTRGPIWFEVPDADPVELHDGDIIILPHGLQHTLTDRVGSPPVPFTSLVHALSGTPPTLRWGGNGEHAEALCGFFQSTSAGFNPLVEALPQVVVARNDEPERGWVPAVLTQAFADTMDQSPGAAATTERLTELLFLEALRRHFQAGGDRGLFAALEDSTAGAALRLIHSDPDRPWSLESLSTEIGVSRSALAERFTQLLGRPPIQYLTAWRLERAGQRLAEGVEPIAAIARASGYGSVSAFNRAFSRHTGFPPAAWRRRHVAAVA